jgi:hypothetical protein
MYEGLLANFKDDLVCTMDIQSNCKQAYVHMLPNNIMYIAISYIQLEAPESYVECEGRKFANLTMVHAC